MTGLLIVFTFLLKKLNLEKKFPNPEFDHSVSHNFSAMVNSKLVSSSPL